MVYLFVSILFSVSVGILFKFIKARTTINIFLIAVNYLCAIAATWIFFRPQIQLRAIPFNIYNLSLSILLPLVFILLSLSIRYSGIMKTDIAQRISLVIPIACSYWVFNETIPILRWLGIVIGFIAMFFILNKAQHSPEKNALYLLLVFFGYGIIDVLFKMVALQKSVPYTTALFYIFCGSFIVAAAITLFSLIKNKIVIRKSDFFYGLLLGLFNFLNIYFYLEAHQYFSENPTTVFATMNFGVILLGTLVGAVYFKEKLSSKNVFGLIMAVIAVLLVVVSQLE